MAKARIMFKSNLVHFFQYFLECTRDRAEKAISRLENLIGLREIVMA